jgi:HSP20 family protein
MTKSRCVGKEKCVSPGRCPQLGAAVKGAKAAIDLHQTGLKGQGSALHLGNAARTAARSQAKAYRPHKDNIVSSLPIERRMAMRSLVPFPWSNEAVRRGADDPFAALQNEVNRIFDGFGRFGLLQNEVSALRLDVSETQDAIEIHADVPGLTGNEVELTLTGDVLTIRGEKKSEKEDERRDYHLVERRYGAFARSVRLPFVADAGTAKASFEKGVLTVSIPKPKEQREKSTRIPIK